MKKLFFVVWIMMLSMMLQAQDTVQADGYRIFYYPNGVKSSEGTMRQGKPDGYWKTYYPNGVLKTEGNRKNFELDSLWKFYDSKGNLTLSITYKNGIKNGPRTTYLKHKTIVENFVNGKKDGLTKEYDEQYRLRKIIPYNEGLENGVSLSYASDGRIVAIARFKKGFLLKRQYINAYDDEGKKNGLWLEFYPGEQYISKTETTYRHGIVDGYKRYYNPDGSLNKIEKYVNGVRIADPPELAEYDIKTDYYPDGSIKVIGSYKDGVPEGMRREYDKKGNIVAGYVFYRGRLVGKGIIDNQGQKQGPWVEYYLSGKKSAEGNYTNNVRTGPWVFYFENGNVEQRGSYDKQGRATGKWTWYYPNQSLRRVEHFYEGVEQGHMVEYAADSTVMVEGDYVDGTKEGKWIENVNGYRTEGEYLEDMKEGLWKSYYPNGNLYFEGSYIDDIPDGKQVWYYRNGHKRKEGSYSMGLRNGEWRYYDDEGKLFLLVEYNEGIEIRYDSKKVVPELDPSEMTE